MKKISLILTVLVCLCCGTGYALEFGDLLARLNSRDFSAEVNTYVGTEGSFYGETANPLANTIMFKARDEFRAMISAARGSSEQNTELSAFILNAQKEEISLETKVWLLHQLAVTGTAAEVPALEEILKSDQPVLVSAAATTLAKIPGQEATDALTRNIALPDVAAALLCRNTAIPEALNESVMPFALPYVSNEEVADWMKQYNQLSELEKVQTLAAITVREDKQYRQVALDAIASDAPELQRAGLEALEKLGETEDIDLLLAHRADYHDLVFRICGFIVSDGFDAALQARALATDDENLFQDLAVCLVARGVDLRPELFAKTTAKECPNRLSLLRMLSKIATADDVANMVASTVLIPRGTDHDAAENLVAACCKGDATPLIALLDKYPPTALYSMIGRTGGDAARNELTRSLESDNQEMKAVAIRALTLWPDATFADKILAMLNEGKCNESQATSLLRSYIRVISLPDDKIGITLTADEKLDKLKSAYAMAKRPEEKQLVLSRLAANRTMNSLAFAVECAAEADVAEAAYAAIAGHAHDTVLRNENPEPMLKAIDLVIQNSSNQELVERVKIYKGRMQ